MKKMALFIALFLFGVSAQADGEVQYARALFRKGMYLSSARMAHRAANFGIIARALLKAGMHQSAVYFYIKALDSQDPVQIQEALLQLPQVIRVIGIDPFLKRTQFPAVGAGTEIWDWLRGRQAFHLQQYPDAVKWFSKIKPQSPQYDEATLFKATSLAFMDRLEEALAQFKLCQGNADRDLRAKCQAGEARVLYQQGKFKEANRVYAKISKDSIVWTGTLFEQAWVAYSRKQYNLALGKLISYRSPVLQFIFNPEVELLRAQSYIGLCHYAEAKKSLDEFLEKYRPIVREVKFLVEANGSDLKAFFDFGMQQKPVLAFGQKLIEAAKKTEYFDHLVKQYQKIPDEKLAVEVFLAQLKVPKEDEFALDLGRALAWRKTQIQEAGGQWMKSFLLDEHAALVDQFEKASFLQIDMIRRERSVLMASKTLEEAEMAEEKPSSSYRLGVIPRDEDQMVWEFNGEFWNDELGDYALALRNLCH